MSPLTTRLGGWGRYPTVDARRCLARSAADCQSALAQPGGLIARGLGRSYGDSSLAPRVLDLTHFDGYMAFDQATGELSCAAGTSLADILRTFVPRGWFLPVTPGTRFVTVGGAIASDVHGKNHHVDGCFSQHVLAFDLLLGNGERVSCDRASHPELFAATCGGMGLTGVILTVRFRLRRIRSSLIRETTIKARDLDSVLEAFDAHAGATYSVAWIDCLARGRALGRSLLMLGEHAEEGPLGLQPDGAITVPIDAPAWLLNRSTMQAFNSLYYALGPSRQRQRHVPFEPYFYPLDRLRQWNRLYGRAGFLQYQFVLPTEAGAAGLREVLGRITASGKGSFLAVLKAFGPGNDHPLSFPKAGYTLALDFQAEPSVFALLDELDALVLHHGGRLYLAKDARMSLATFRAGYPRWQAFEEVRARYHAIGHFGSIQSRRLGLQ